MELDSIKKQKKNDRQAIPGEPTKRGVDILMEAKRYWDNWSEFREQRRRAIRYCYGDQWSDIIRDENGTAMTEERYIKQQNTVPLKNNLIRRLVRNVIGVYRNQDKEPVCFARDRDEKVIGETMTTMLQYNRTLNRMTKVYARTFEDFLISAVAIHRSWYGWKKDRQDVWSDYVNPACAFIDSNMRDFRGDDVSCIGEIHDESFSSVLQAFATSQKDAETLARIYRAANDNSTLAGFFGQWGMGRDQSFDFLHPADPSLCRVIEVWRKETKPRYRCHDYLTGEVFKCEVEDYNVLVAEVNAQRKEQAAATGVPMETVPLIAAEWFVDCYWYFYFLSPFGHILREGETPYEHHDMPYTFEVYPFINGEPHSFVGDVIDQQRYVNRLITMQDWIMRASAKGVLLVPADCIPDDMSVEDFADEWSRHDGLIVYKPSKTGAVPQQVASNSVNIGINELLNLQLKMFEDISGVNGALQGKPGYSNISGVLYAQQTQNATTSLSDILESYSEFVINESYKVVKLMQQFYDEKKYVNIVGRDALDMKQLGNIPDVEFDLSIKESQSSTVFRETANQLLLQIWQSGQISLEQLLEVGDFPFADKLLQSIQSQQQQMEQQQQQQPVPPELMKQAQQGADMDSVNKAYEMLRNNLNTKAA